MFNTGVRRVPNHPNHRLANNPCKLEMFKNFNNLLIVSFRERGESLRVILKVKIYFVNHLSCFIYYVFSGFYKSKNVKIYLINHLIF